jgi:hypothetical protein
MLSANRIFLPAIAPAPKRCIPMEHRVFFKLFSMGLFGWGTPFVAVGITIPTHKIEQPYPTGEG